MKHAVNGNGNGNGNGIGTGNASGTSARLAKLQAYHESMAAAIRTTRALLDGDATATKQQRAPDVISQAIALDAARRQGGKRRHYDGKPGAEIRARRKRTAAFLDSLSTTTPKQAKMNGVPGGAIGTLLRHGFIKRSGDGYIRTAKPFSLTRP